MSLRIVLQRLGPRRWTASCAQWRSVAQGESGEEALSNLHELAQMYPDLTEHVHCDGDGDGLCCSRHMDGNPSRVVHGSTNQHQDRVPTKGAEE